MSHDCPVSSCQSPASHDRLRGGFPCSITLYHISRGLSTSVADCPASHPRLARPLYHIFRGLSNPSRGAALRGVRRRKRRRGAGFGKIARFGLFLFIK